MPRTDSSVKSTDKAAKSWIEISPPIAAVLSETDQFTVKTLICHAPQNVSASDGFGIVQDNQHMPVCMTVSDRNNPEITSNGLFQVKQLTIIEGFVDMNGNITDHSTHDTPRS